MILDDNMFCARSELWTLSYLNTTHIVLKIIAMKFRLWVEKLKYCTNFKHEVKEQRSFLHFFGKGQFTQLQLC